MPLLADTRYLVFSTRKAQCWAHSFYSPRSLRAILSLTTRLRDAGTGAERPGWSVFSHHMCTAVVLKQCCLWTLRPRCHCPNTPVLEAHLSLQLASESRAWLTLLLSSHTGHFPTWSEAIFKFLFFTLENSVSHLELGQVGLREPWWPAEMPWRTRLPLLLQSRQGSHITAIKRHLRRVLIITNL